MFSKKLMKTTWIVAVIALILVFAFVFVACDNANKNNQSNNGGNTVVDDGGNTSADNQGKDDDNQGNQGEGQGTNTGDNTGEQGNQGEGQGNEGQGQGNEGQGQGNEGQGQGNEGQGEGNEGQGQGNEGQGDTPTYQLDVNLAEGLVLTADDLASLDGALNVSVVLPNGTRTEVQFVVKSTTVSEDGTYADVVIEAYGVEKTIQVPLYVEEPLIREDLQPIYDVLTQEGDKSLTLTLTGTYCEGTGIAPSGYALTAILNMLEEEGYQFALYGQSGDEQDVFALYNDGEIVVGNNAIDISRILQFIAAAMSEEESEVLLAGDAEEGYDAVGAVDGEYEDDEEMDDVTYAFIRLSNALDVLDAFVESPIAQLVDGLTVAKFGGLYTATIDSKSLMTVLQQYIDMNAEEDDEPIDIAQIVSILDEQLDGAIAAGDIKLQVSLVIANQGVVLSLNAENVRTGAYATLTASLKVAGEAAELPSCENVEPKDLEITIPVSLPQKELYVTLDMYVHISDMFAEAGKDYVTAYVTLNEENVVRFNFNDYYVYLDITGLMGMFAEEEADYTAFYYAPVDKNKEPVSFFDSIVSMFGRKFIGDDDYDDDDYGFGKPEEGYVDDEYGKPSDDVGYYDNQDEEIQYFAMYKEGSNGVFPIGTTESTFRAALEVGYYDPQLDEERLINDYTINGFDSSASFNGTVTIVFENGEERELDVIIYKADSVGPVALNVDSLKAARYSTIGDLDLGATLTYSDGVVEFLMVPTKGVVVDQLDGAEVNEKTMLTEAGNHKLLISWGQGTLSTQVALYVYDPSNPVIVEVRSFDTLYITMDETLDQLRNDLGELSVLYDNDEEVFVKDFDIEGYEPGVEFVTLSYQGFSTTVNLVYEEAPDYPGYGDDEDDHDGFDIMTVLPYFRFIDVNDDMMTGIMNSIDNFKALIENENTKALFADVYSFESDEEGFVLRVFINNEDDVDLLALINLFVGIPDEEIGYVDIDENLLFAMLSDKEEADVIYSTFRQIVGAELEDVVGNLCFEVTGSIADGLSIDFTLCDCSGEVVYFSIGIGAKLVPQVEQFELTADEIKDALDFGDIMEYVYPILMQFMNADDNAALANTVFVGTGIADNDVADAEVYEELAKGIEISFHEDGKLSFITYNTYDADKMEVVEAFNAYIGTYEVEDGNVYITLIGYIVEDNTIYYEEEDRVIMEGNLEDGKLYLGFDGSFPYTAVLEAAKIVEIEQMPK